MTHAIFLSPSQKWRLMAPGQITSIRMPCLSDSIAAWRVKDLTASLDAAWAVLPGNPHNAEMDD